MGKFMDITGCHFGKLTVVKRASNKIQDSGNIVTMWECICECGNKRIVDSASLRKGRAKSCGCWKDIHGEKNPNYKHGESTTRLYKIWEGMHKRCKYMTCLLNG